MAWTFTFGEQEPSHPHLLCLMGQRRPERVISEPLLVPREDASLPSYILRPRKALGLVCLSLLFFFFSPFKTLGPPVQVTVFSASTVVLALLVLLPSVFLFT